MALVRCACLRGMDLGPIIQYDPECDYIVHRLESLEWNNED